MHLLNVKDHILECGTMESWFEACLSNPADERWGERSSLEVKDRLGMTLPLVEVPGEGGDGFDGECVSRDSLNLAFSRVREAARETLSLDSDFLGETVAVDIFTPTRTTVNNMHGSNLKPNGRIVVMPAVEPPELVLRRCPPPVANSGHVVPEIPPRLTDMVVASLLEHHPNVTDQWTVGLCLHDTIAQSRSCFPQNCRRMLGSAAFVLYNDPRRTRLYGITIEKTVARFWHFDRGLVLISPVFDCRKVGARCLAVVFLESDNSTLSKKPEHFIRFSLYLMYASPVQLGYDPTVKMVNDGKEGIRMPDFIYRIGEGLYRTIGQPLSEEDAFFTISPGLRIWRVRACDEEGVVQEGADERMLRDLWVPEGTLHEKDIQAQILQALPTDQAEEMGKLLLGILDEVTLQGETQTTLAKPPDATQFRLFLPNTDPIWEYPLTSLGLQFRRTQLDSFTRYMNRIAPPKPRLYHRQTHRRVLLECCLPFYEVPSPRVAWQVSKEFVRGLDLFRRAGFIHRNISGASCVLSFDRGAQRYQAKLGHLEYCARYQTAELHDHISEPGAFSAIEVLKRDWRGKGIDYDRLPPFHPHYYHDLESFFWLLTWYITTYLPIGDGDNMDDIVSKIYLLEWKERVSDELFPVEYHLRPAHFRVDLGLNPVVMGRRLVRDVGWPIDTVECLQKISALVGQFEDAYAALQQNPPGSGQVRWPEASFDDLLYGEFKKALDVVADCLATGGCVSMWELMKEGMAMWNHDEGEDQLEGNDH
ncbi:other/FunK1 protein kinase [Coprinopsis cinerea okayama7|uniref:Other/FunK1 protein kinase n=1 Tax=Coprinopsis cinerea (strain Okayama-7 / 130 / ATCC MYA-4618 / FGSC 9003) TaxID=240176 RepID=A8NK68_COPC7|nr:other/FunK1 protein kinase [Coprinopsis cinerea okayama7\|eukprot:XP_001834365.2 other/FunK1 protein kinase [Coprinopsis cinerea okayama7\